ncbi:MAG: type I-C CRISPR-associated protein Cas8c/Csd1, partial [Halothiobacillaceae bacterium]
MLNRLAEYAKRKGMSPQPGFGHANIHWILVLDRNGSPVNLRRANVTDSRRPEPWQCARAPITPANVLNAGGKSHFLWESVAVVLDWPKTNVDQKAASKIHQKHEFFKNLIRNACTADSSLQPLVDFYTNSGFVQEARKLAEDANATQDENLTFAVADQVVLQGTQWRDWW